MVLLPIIIFLEFNRRIDAITLELKTSNANEIFSDQSGWESLNDYFYKIEQDMELVERTRKYLENMKK